MVNKIFSSKLCLFLIVMVSLFLLVPNTALSAENVIQMEHKTNVTTNKEWKITFNRAINGDELSKRVKVYGPRGITVPIITSYHNNIITVKPPASGYVPGQTYSLQIFESITDLNSSPLKAAVTMNFTIAIPVKGPLVDAGNMKYTYKPYNNTLNQIVAIQSAVRPVNVVSNYYLNPSSKDIYEYMNPKNFEYHEYASYQFLELNYIDGISEADLNTVLKGKGILEGQGKTFLDACDLYDINPAYIIAHALLETGNGNSALANGIIVSNVNGSSVASKTTYNMFGIGAYDANANKFGSERAYTEEWFTPQAAIKGGVEFISTQYINNSSYKQNTLYKMRWNPEHPATHQYATDIAWSYKQSYRIKDFMDQYTNAKLQFEIPQYK